MKIVILGNGMAGLSMAIYAKKKQLEPILLVKELPRINYGESAHPGFKTIFDLVAKDINIDKLFYRTSGIITTNQDGFETCNKYSIENDWKGYQLERPKFDNILFSYAKNLGVEIISINKTNSLKVIQNSYDFIESISLDKTIVKGDIFVDATGRNKILSKKLGILSIRLSEKLVCTYGQFNDEPHIHSDYAKFKWNKNGWLWESQINQSIKSWVILHKAGGKPELNKKYKNTVLGSRNCTWNYNLKPFQTNFFSIGDSAFSFDPSSSNGILKSFMTSIIVIDLIKDLKLPEAGKFYSDWTKKWIKKDFNELFERYSQNGVNIKTVSNMVYK